MGKSRILQFVFERSEQPTITASFKNIFFKKHKRYKQLWLIFMLSTMHLFIDSFLYLLNICWAPNVCQMLCQALSWRCDLTSSSVVVPQHGNLSLLFYVVYIVDWLIPFVVHHSSSMFFSTQSLERWRFHFPRQIFPVWYTCMRSGMQNWSGAYFPDFCLISLANKVMNCEVFW